MSSELIDEELRQLDFKLNQLKRDYDQYFLGTRPREPVMLRSDVNKMIIRLTNTSIKNTALRFRFTSLCSRFQAQRRQWDEVLRKIEAGTYERHQFKARQRSGAPEAKPAATPESAPDLFRSYLDARLACGQSVKGITRDKLEKVVADQRDALSKKFGNDSAFDFQVKIEDGKVRLKASRA